MEWRVQGCCRIRGRARDLDHAAVADFTRFLEILARAVAQLGGTVSFSGRVLFSSHLLCSQHFISRPRQTSPAAGVETIRLRDAVKNTWVRPARRTFGAV